MKRARWWLGATVLTLTACADAPFERANIWDPRYALAGEILPRVDSVLSRGTTLQLRLELEDTLPTVPVAWTVVCIPEIAAGPCPTASISNQGLLQVEPTPFPRRLRVIASFGSQQYQRELTAFQKAASWRFQCQPDLVPTCNTRGAFDQPLGRMVHYYDANDFLIPAVQALPDTLETLASYSLVPPGVLLRVGGYLRTGFQNGSTLVVRGQLGVVDTLPFVVAQTVATAHTACGDYSLGDTVTLAFSNVRDPNQYEVVRPLREYWAVSATPSSAWSYDSLTRRLTATGWPSTRLRVGGTLRDSITGALVFSTQCDVTFYW